MNVIVELFYNNYKRGVFKDLDYIKIPWVRKGVEEQLAKDKEEEAKGE